MHPLKTLAVVVVLASLTACSNSDSDPGKSPKTEATNAPSATTAAPTATTAAPKPEKTYVPAPGDPKTHVVTVIIRDKGRAYTAGSCAATRGATPDPDIIAFFGPTRHFDNTPLKGGEFPIPKQGKSLADGRCEATLTVTVPYAPRYTVGTAIVGHGISSPNDPKPTKFVTKGSSQEVVLLNYPT